MAAEPTLGAHDNHAYIYDRLGRDRLLQLTPSALDWSRVLNAVSEGGVVVPPARCTTDLEKVHTWAHTLVMYRDTERVWEGPIRRIEHSEAGMVIRARDVLGWLDRRPVRNARVLEATPVVTEALWSLAQGYGLDDPNVLDWLLHLGGVGGDVSRDVQVASTYHGDDLASLVAGGLRFTVVGRRIVVWPESFATAQLPTLLPDRHLGATVKLTEDGDSLATETTTRDDEGGVARATGPDGLVDPFYGYVGVLASAGPGTATPASLLRYATSTQAQLYPAPLSLDLPTDATLAPSSPFPMGVLVPGAGVPVRATTAAGTELASTFVLAGVKVTQAEGSNEKVAISLDPPSSVEVS